jgi:hypothetical protein
VTAAVLCLVLGLTIQFLIVSLRYGGNWTALFCTGAKFKVPPSLTQEGIYLFPNSGGYDGQMYHYVAHDPLARTDIPRYMDSSRVRYRRILLPALAYLLALGRQGWIDFAYITANLLFLFAGAWWLSRYLELSGLPPQLAALFVLAPAALISLDRLTVDLAFTALCAGFALYLRREQYSRAVTVLALACLTRDTGFVLAAAASLAFLIERKWSRVAATIGAAVPAAAWYLYVNSRTPAYPNIKAGQLTPFRGILDTLADPISYPFTGVLSTGLQWLDRLALLGFLLAVLLSLWLVRRRGVGPMEAAMVLWSILGLCLPRAFWEDSFSGARIFTPLMIYLFLVSAPLPRWLAMAPLLMVLPRVALQIFAPEVGAFVGGN